MPRRCSFLTVRAVPCPFRVRSKTLYQHRRSRLCNCLFWPFVLVIIIHLVRFLLRPSSLAFLRRRSFLINSRKSLQCYGSSCSVFPQSHPSIPYVLISTSYLQTPGHRFVPHLQIHLKVHRRSRFRLSSRHHFHCGRTGFPRQRRTSHTVHLHPFRKHVRYLLQESSCFPCQSQPCRIHLLSPCFSSLNLKTWS